MTIIVCSNSFSLIIVASLITVTHSSYLTHHHHLTHHRHSSTSDLHLHIAVSDSFYSTIKLHLSSFTQQNLNLFEFTPFHYTPKLFHAHSIQTLSQTLTPLPYLLFETTIIDYFIHHKSQTTKMNSGDGSVLSLRSFSDILILHLNKGVSP